MVLSVPGEHNVLNSLAAFIACVESGAEVDKIKASLLNFTEQEEDLNFAEHSTASQLQTIMLTTQKK